jgi:hypothetical protein
MAFPADRFVPRPADERLPLRLPRTLAPVVPAQRPAPPPENLPAQQVPAPAVPAPAQAPPALPVPLVMSTNGVDPVNLAVEIDRTVPPSGNLQVCGQQFWLGPHRAGTAITLWADTTRIHLSANGVRLKTVPSRLTVAHLTQLLAEGGRPAAPPGPPVSPGSAVEVDRLISPIGVIGLVGRQHPVGYHFAGRRVTVRLDGGLLQLVDQGTLLRSLPNPLTPAEQARLRDARPAGPAPQPSSDPIRVQRRVNCRGGLVVARQRIHIGIRHAAEPSTSKKQTAPGASTTATSCSPRSPAPPPARSPGSRSASQSHPGNAATTPAALSPQKRPRIASIQRSSSRTCHLTWLKIANIDRVQSLTCCFVVDLAWMCALNRWLYAVGRGSVCARGSRRRREQPQCGSCTHRTVGRGI